MSTGHDRRASRRHNTGPALKDKLRHMAGINCRRHVRRGVGEHGSWSAKQPGWGILALISTLLDPAEMGLCLSATPRRPIRQVLTARLQNRAPRTSGWWERLSPRPAQGRIQGTKSPVLCKARRWGGLTCADRKHSRSFQGVREQSG